jgi:hypothetical protein
MDQYTDRSIVYWLLQYSSQESSISTVVARKAPSFSIVARKTQLQYSSEESPNSSIVARKVPSFSTVAREDEVKNSGPSVLRSTSVEF